MENWLKRKSPDEVPLEKQQKLIIKSISPKRHAKKVAFAAAPSTSSVAALPKSSVLPPNSLHLILPVNTARKKVLHKNSLLVSHSVSLNSVPSALPLKSAMAVIRDRPKGTTGVDEERKFPIETASKVGTVSSIAISNEVVTTYTRPVTNQFNVTLPTSSSKSSTIILSGHPQRYRTDDSERTISVDNSILNSILSIHPKPAKDAINVDTSSNSLATSLSSTSSITSVSSTSIHKIERAASMTEGDKKLPDKESSMKTQDALHSSSRKLFCKSVICDIPGNGDDQLPVQASEVISSDKEDSTLDLNSDLNEFHPTSTATPPTLTPSTATTAITDPKPTSASLSLSLSRSQSLPSALPLPLPLPFELLERSKNDTRILEKNNCNRSKCQLNTENIEIITTVSHQEGSSTAKGHSSIEKMFDITENNGNDKSGVEKVEKQIIKYVEIEDEVHHLVTLRQESMNAFLMSGLVGPKGQNSSLRSAPLPFIRDPILLSGPMSVLNMKHSQVRDREGGGQEGGRETRKGIREGESKGWEK